MDRAQNNKSFIQTRKVERHYAAQLRKIARHVGELINTMWRPDDITTSSEITTALDRYARIIEPWARVVGQRMVAEVSSRDRKAWREHSAEMSRLMRSEIAEAPVGIVMRERLASQVDLITSLPREAAERVHKLTLEGITQGTRAKAIAAEIMRSGEVTASRANLIARTEVGRTATELTKARAESVGSTHFIWRTTGDSDVRESHRHLNGKTFRWDTPPECDPGHHALPGAIWNCRCYPEPVIGD